VTNFLFGKDEEGIDLLAINIQRGRDHGIQGFVHYYDICAGRTKGSSLNDIRKEVSQEVINYREDHKVVPLFAKKQLF
jgi:hypothetical protein